ncbi:MAG: hypothetical protein KKG59_02425 [Nanoarchaeota archaeon]|nr:hypothetical protein [Nanoarchaeota archaeon]
MVAGLLLILIPKKVIRFQIWVINRLHVRFDEKKKYTYHPYVGGIFVLVAIALFVYAIMH